jgi:hypothetical protein
MHPSKQDKSCTRIPRANFFRLIQIDPFKLFSLSLSLSLFLSSSGSSPESASPLDEKIAQVVTVEGGRADLPCDTTAPTPGDSIYLVLWYRTLDSSGTPIYR